MRYDNLQSLLQNSSGTRRYFVGLPVPVQLQLHERNEFIRTQQDLRLHAECIQRQSFLQ